MLESPVIRVIVTNDNKKARHIFACQVDPLIHPHIWNHAGQVWLRRRYTVNIL